MRLYNLYFMAAMGMIFSMVLGAYIRSRDGGCDVEKIPVVDPVSLVDEETKKLDAKIKELERKVYRIRDIDFLLMAMRQSNLDTSDVLALRDRLVADLGKLGSELKENKNVERED